MCDEDNARMRKADSPYKESYQSSTRPSDKAGKNKYVCIECKNPLEGTYCPRCVRRFDVQDGVPIFLPSDFAFQRASEIAVVYDSIYRQQANVWESQGRTPEFLKYFASLLARFPHGRYLEIGCGEGFLLSRVQAPVKFATDLSIQAIGAARTRAEAEFSIAIAERLPFPDEYFDSIAAVGVMEHFLDPQAALQEIRRVLKPGGHFINLIHVQASAWERLALKFWKYVFPRPHPLRLMQWIMGRFLLPKQPIQREYTIRSGNDSMVTAGFKVVDTIHKAKNPELPLVTFSVIYVCRKQEGKR